MELKKAKELLKSGDYTCVLCLGDKVITSRERGIAPLIKMLDCGAIKAGFSAADKVVGKAPACVYALMGARAVYANIITTPAIEIFERFGIAYEFETEVPMIRNRTDTDFCPVEKAVKDYSEPTEIIAAARRKYEEMNKKTTL